MFVSLLVNIAKAVWRALNVWRKAPEESHTAVEYVDALLFPQENSSPSNSAIVAGSVDQQLLTLLPTQLPNRISRNTRAPNA